MLGKFIRNSNEISENLWTPLCVKNGFSFITINGMAIKVLLSKQAVLYFIRHSSRSDSLFVLLKVTSYKFMRWATFITTIRNLKAWTVWHLIFSQHCCLSKEIKTNIFTETMMSSENKMTNSSSLRLHFIKRVHCMTLFEGLLPSYWWWN